MDTKKTDSPGAVPEVNAVAREASGPSRMRVGPDHGGKTLEAIVRAMLEVAWGRARDLVKSGRVTVDGRRVDDAVVRVREGAMVEVDPQGRRISSLALRAEDIVYADDGVVVINKAAGALTVPTEEGERDTVVDRVRAWLRSIGARDDEVGIVHRLDRDTSGLLCFARTFAMKRFLAEQFEHHTVERAYLAIAHGNVTSQTVETMLVRDRGDGLRGSFGRRYPSQRKTPPGGEPPQEAQRAVTHIEALASLEGATLVRCRLETGRQHQIRIHLSELGHALVGETVYIRDHRGTRITAPRIMLHATTLGFDLPGERKALLTMKPPDDLLGTFARLGGKKKVIDNLFRAAEGAPVQPKPVSGG